MDELEARIAALELAVIELAAALAVADPAVVIAARDAIGEGLAGAGDELERVARGAAWQLLDDGLQRHTVAAAGGVVRPEANDR